MCVVCVHTRILNNVHILLHILGRHDCKGLCVVSVCIMSVCHACMRECVMGVSRSTKKNVCECVLFVYTHVF